MGTGIAYSAALAGCDVTVVENNANALQRMMALLRETAGAGIKRGKLTATEADAVLQRIQCCTGIESLVKDVDIAIESVPERLELKIEVLGRLANRRPKLIATNTSALSINALAKSVLKADQFLGMHFFNPVWSIKLIELIVGDETSAETLETAKNFAEKLGKASLVVRDVPGFATSRLDLVASLEAIRMVEGGVASAEDIDRAAVLAYGHPMGPLRLSDIVGLDVRLDIAAVLERAHGPAFAAPQLLKDMVARGDLGQKSGRGFFEW